MLMGYVREQQTDRLFLRSTTVPSRPVCLSHRSRPKCDIGHFTPRSRRHGDALKGALNNSCCWTRRAEEQGVVTSAFISAAWVPSPSIHPPPLMLSLALYRSLSLSVSLILSIALSLSLSLCLSHSLSLSLSLYLSLCVSLSLVLLVNWLIPPSVWLTLQILLAFSLPVLLQFFSFLSHLQCRPTACYVENRLHNTIIM